MITVRGTHAEGEVVAFPLPHGADPEDELRARGWLPGEATAAGRAPSVTLTYAVTPGAVVPSPVCDRAPGRATSGWRPTRSWWRTIGCSSPS